MEDKRFKEYEGLIKDTTIQDFRVIMDRKEVEYPVPDKIKIEKDGTRTKIVQPNEKKIIYFVEVYQIVNNEEVKINRYEYPKRKDCSNQFRAKCKEIRENYRKAEQDEHNKKLNEQLAKQAKEKLEQAKNDKQE